jgi:uncharacterized tellurite resistance protein B-like protein
LISKLLNHFKIKQDKSTPHSEKDIKLAAVCLLIEVAKADHELSSQEEATLIDALNTMYELEASEKETLIALAKEKSSNATSLYEYTSVINEHFPVDEKFQLIINMWKIAYSDQRIDRFEEHLIRRVADLIYVPHVQFIEAKHIASANSN